MAVFAVAVNTKVWWYLARSSGLIAWLLVAGSVTWGMVVSGRLARKMPPPAWTLDIHRFLGGMAIVFTSLHLVGLMLDPFIHFSIPQLLIPFRSPYKPGTVAWGIVGLYVLLAVELTSLMMRWLPRKMWRYIHGSSFGLFGLLTIHGFTSGTDAKHPLVRWTALVVCCVGAIIIWLRLLIPWFRQQRRDARRSATPPPPDPVDALLS